jgi:hypothetical protein
MNTIEAAMTLIQLPVRPSAALLMLAAVVAAVFTADQRWP